MSEILSDFGKEANETPKVTADAQPQPATISPNRLQSIADLMAQPAESTDTPVAKTETPKAEISEVLVLKQGLNAVIMPELRDVFKDERFGDSFGDVSAEVARDRLQKFLDEIQKQGGKVLSTVSQMTNENPSEMNGDDPKLTTFFIVEKS